MVTSRAFEAFLEKLLYGRWLAIMLVPLSAIAWSATFILFARTAAPLSKVAELVIAFTALAILASSIWALKNNFLRLSGWMRQTFSRHGLILALAIGVTLRVLWVLAFPAEPASDGLVYLGLAQKIVAGDIYQTAGTMAFWPPGYPFYLSLWLLVFPAKVAIPLSQIALFAVGAWGIHRLTNKLGNQAAATFATFLFAVWPNLITQSATPEKEMLVTALLIWAFVGLLGSTTMSVFFTGIALGAATLVQPSTQLLIPALSLLQLIRCRWKFWPRPAALLLGAILVIAPWTLRNYEALGAFRLVSTNGGDVLYRANNGLATGGYTQKGEINLEHLGELERDSVAKELAIKWIRENPLRFLGLAVEKQILFMGDDAGGVYGTFRAQGEQRNNKVYLPLKLAANLWWLFAWLSIAALVIAGSRLGHAGFLVWAWIYLFALHSVFESAGKYHVPILWIPCVLLGILVGTNVREQSRDVEQV